MGQQRVDSWYKRLRRRNLATRAAMVGLALMPILVIAAPIAHWLRGWTGVAAALMAAGVCLLGATAALVASHVFRSPQQVLQGVLLGMAARMGLPLALAVIVLLVGGRLADAGFLFYLLVFYPVTLGVETAMSLPESQQLNRSVESPQDAS